MKISPRPWHGGSSHTSETDRLMDFKLWAERDCRFTICSSPFIKLFHFNINFVIAHRYFIFFPLRMKSLSISSFQSSDMLHARNALTASLTTL